MKDTLHDIPFPISMYTHTCYFIFWLLSGLQGGWLYFPLHLTVCTLLPIFHYQQPSSESQRNGAVFELAADHSASSKNILENKVAWQHY